MDSFSFKLGLCKFGYTEGSRRRQACLPLLLACAIALCLPSPGLAQEANPNASQTFTLTGSVVNETSGEPIPRALVTVAGQVLRHAFTDSNGGFSIEDVEAGRHSVSVQKPGFFEAHEASGRGAKMVEVGPSGEPVVLRLAQENVIFGRLTDVNGQPIESVSIRLIERRVRNGRLRWEAHGFTNSDDDGTYRFASLRPGTYYIEAGPDVPQRETLFGSPEQERTGWPGLYFPGAPDLSSASPIIVTSGQQFQADMVMNRVPLYTVAGRVSGFQVGHGVSILVQNSSGDQVPVGTHFRPDTGLFDIRLPAGSYKLAAFCQVGEQQMRADIHLTVERDLTQLHLALQPSVSIPIRTHLEDRTQNSGGGAGSPVVRAGVVSPDDLPPLSAHLVATEAGGPDAYAVVMGSKGNRSFIFRNVQPGRYSAEISSYGGWYVESAQCGNTNLLTEDLVVTSGTVCSIDVSLRNDSGNLELKAKTSDTFSSGMALLMPARGHGRVRQVPLYVSDPSNPTQIDITINGIAPGDYLLYAFDNPEKLEYSNPETLGPYSSQAVPVTISPGQTANVTAQLIQSGADSE